VTVVVDTAEVPPDERFDAWAEASLQVFEPIAVRRGTTRPFGGKLVRHTLGPLQLLHLTADASTARRTPELIRAGDPESVQLMLQLGGACGVAQEDRSTLVRPGELVSWHSSTPYVVDSRIGFDMLIVTCPALLLRPHTDRVLRHTAQRIDGSDGTGSLVRQYLLALHAALDAGAIPDAGRGHLAEGLFDLVRALYATREPATRPQTRSSHELRAQIHAYIDAHLGEPDLDRARIARSHYISCSYLDRLFESEHAGVSETIRAKRLDRSRRDLDDPALAHESIFDIASRWGFVSPSHFSRAFRAAYGRSPSAYRAGASARSPACPATGSRSGPGRP
jgi:AraC-like DNA-binding protein